MGEGSKKPSRERVLRKSGAKTLERRCKVVIVSIELKIAHAEIQVSFL